MALIVFCISNITRLASLRLVFLVLRLVRLPLGSQSTACQNGELGWRRRQGFML